LFFLVAHPKKLEKNKDGEYPMPTMYDIAGSSDFWNMADYGISLRREVDAATKANKNFGKMAIQKVKFKHLGSQGIWEWNYNYVNGRYVDENASLDNRCWIEDNSEREPVDSISLFESEFKKNEVMDF
jgi:twinkle protein